MEYFQQSPFHFIVYILIVYYIYKALDDALFPVTPLDAYLNHLNLDAQQFRIMIVLGVAIYVAFPCKINKVLPNPVGGAIEYLTGPPPF